MNFSKTYLLYEVEKDNGTRLIRLSREDGRLDQLIKTFKATCLEGAERLLRQKHPAIVLEVYSLPLLFLMI